MPTRTHNAFTLIELLIVVAARTVESFASDSPCTPGPVSAQEICRAHAAYLFPSPRPSFTR
jgi:hypothetical protein